MDGELRSRVIQREAKPMVHVPLVDVQKLGEPSIIDKF
jgi:hypothetical protein